MKTSSWIAVLLILVMFVVPMPALAQNEYVGAYPTLGKANIVDFVSQAWWWDNYTGTVAGDLNQWIGAVGSIAGAESSGTQGIYVLSGTVYQAGTALWSASHSPASEIVADPQVWFESNLGWEPTNEELGTISTVSYIYVTLFFNPSDSQQVIFYYEVHLTSGSIDTYQATYTRPSNNTDVFFETGAVTNSGCTDDVIKPFQVGVEAYSTDSETGWLVGYNVEKGSSVGWTDTNGTNYTWSSSGIAGTATQGSKSCITYNSSGTYLVGGAKFVDATAHYYDSNSNYPPGLVDWYYKSGTTISDGTQLWPT